MSIGDAVKCYFFNVLHPCGMMHTPHVLQAMIFCRTVYRTLELAHQQWWKWTLHKLSIIVFPANLLSTAAQSAHAHWVQGKPLQLARQLQDVCVLPELDIGRNFLCWVCFFERVVNKDDWPGRPRCPLYTLAGGRWPDNKISSIVDSGLRSGMMMR